MNPDGQDIPFLPNPCSRRDFSVVPTLHLLKERLWPPTDLEVYLAGVLVGNVEVKGLPFAVTGYKDAVVFCRLQRNQTMSAPFFCLDEFTVLEGVRLTYCRGGGNGERGIAVDGAHLWGLPPEVDAGLLDDAQPVDPDVLDTKQTVDIHDVLEQRRQLGVGNPFFARFEV